MKYRYTCCGLDYTVDADGATNRFDYDELRRQVATTRYFGASNGIKTTNIWGVRALYFFALQLLSGALVPIWFFPDWAIGLLAWSPFAAATSTPVSVYVGRIPPDAALGALALQAAWLVILLGLAGLLWGRARDRVIVQGG